MLRIWISKNKPETAADSLRSVAGGAFPWKAAISVFSAPGLKRAALLLTITSITSALGLSGCASNSSNARSASPASAPAAVSRAVPVHVVPARETPDPAFMSSNTASEASEFIRLGRESMADSAWFEASEYLDSAMAHLAQLETVPSLTSRQRLSVEAYQDSVREWLVEAVSQSARLGGEAEDLSEYLDQEIEEVSFASLEELEALLPRLPNRNYGLPVPSPLPASVLQAMKVFTGSGRGYFEKWLQRKSRYEAMITSKLDERGMPRDLIYLAMVESGFNPKAWSHASASGLWQFISPTGRRYGLHDDWWEDARRDPVRATDAALDYLEDLYADFGDWHQAMAAYNCGEGRIRRQLRADAQLSYWDMSLPSETRFYVPKILAAMIIGNNPASFGFRPGENAAPPLAFDTVTVTRCLPLSGIAEAVGIDEDALKSLNPSLRRWCTPPGRSRYTVYLPEGTREIFYSNHHNIGSETRASAQRHVVTRGQTLSGIARKYGVSVASLQRANGLRGTKVRKGQALTIPGGGDVVVSPVASTPSAAPAAAQVAAVEKADRSVPVRHSVRRGETLSGLAARYGVSMAAIKSANVIKGQIRIGQSLLIPASGAAAPELRVETVAAAAVAPKVHTVRRGETLAGIARLFRVSVSALRRANGLTQRTILQVGQVLHIPAAARDLPDDEEVRAPARSRKVYTVRQGDNLSELAERFGVSQAELQRWNGLRGHSLFVGQKLVYSLVQAYGDIRLASADASNEYYRVKDGDNLWEISSRFGQSVEDVKRLNSGLSEALHPGQRIRVR
jgi:membrane-bound lytic murein transglycosylase D